MGPSVWLVALKAGLACPSESQETNRKSSDGGVDRLRARGQGNTSHTCVYVRGREQSLSVICRLSEGPLNSLAGLSSQIHLHIHFSSISVPLRPGVTNLF